MSARAVRSAAAAVNAGPSVVAAALALITAGVVLSRHVEPGVRVEAVTLAGDTPALRFLPAGVSPRPVALLAHGVTASKETLFRVGEALAAAGFTCFAVDLPGHGESPRSFLDGGNARTLEDVASSLGGVDVFLGHSMGAHAGAEAVRRGRLKPLLFVALGALPDLGKKSGIPLLFLAGRFEEAVSPALLRTEAAGRLVLSPWSDHALEPYDPVLVNAAVVAACTVVGRATPAPPRRWRWRLLGLSLAILGSLVLGHRLPELLPRLARGRGPLLAVIAIAAVALTAGTWLGATPVLRRVPVQLAAMGLSALASRAARGLRVPRWGYAALAATSAMSCLAADAFFLALLSTLFALLLLAGALLAEIASSNGTGRDGDLAFGIFLGYAIGQWMPTIL